MGTNRGVQSSFCAMPRTPAQHTCAHDFVTGTNRGLPSSFCAMPHTPAHMLTWFVTGTNRGVHNQSKGSSFAQCRTHLHTCPQDLLWDSIGGYRAHFAQCLAHLHSTHAHMILLREPIGGYRGHFAQCRTHLHTCSHDLLREPIGGYTNNIKEAHLRNAAHTCTHAHMICYENQ
jgi:hypothetical protein